MRVLLSTLLIIIIIVAAPIAESQDNIGWQFEGTIFIGWLTGSSYQVSAQGTYGVKNSPWLEFVNLSAAIDTYETFHYVGHLARW